MPWDDQEPVADDVVMSARTKVGGERVVVEFDRLPDGSYRLTMGNLFRSREVARSESLEALMRAAHPMLSFDSPKAQEIALGGFDGLLEKAEAAVAEREAAPSPRRG